MAGKHQHHQDSYFEAQLRVTDGGKREAIAAMAAKPVLFRVAPPRYGIEMLGTAMAANPSLSVKIFTNKSGLPCQDTDQSFDGQKSSLNKMPWLQRTRLPCQDTDCVISNAQLIAQREAIEKYHHSLTAWGIKNTASIPWNKMGGRVNEAEVGRLRKYVLMKALKSPLKSLNKEEFGHISERAVRANEDYSSFAQNFDVLTASEEDRIMLQNLRNRACYLADAERQFFNQKLKLKSLINGDKGTKYFHDLVKKSNRDKSITCIIDENEQPTTSLAQVWTKIRDIIGFPKKTIAIRSTIKWIHRLHKGSRKQDHGVAIALACSIYHIWRFRNLVVHEAVDFNPEGLVKWVCPSTTVFVLSVLYHVLLHASMLQQMLLEDAEDLSSGAKEEPKPPWLQKPGDLPGCQAKIRVDQLSAQISSPESRNIQISSQPGKENINTMMQRGTPTITSIAINTKGYKAQIIGMHQSKQKEITGPPASFMDWFEIEVNPKRKDREKVVLRLQICEFEGAKRGAYAAMAAKPGIFRVAKAKIRGISSCPESVSQKAEKHYRISSQPGKENINVNNNHGP
nr:Endonuclease/exonuclease/phosphatase protein [Ipomoea batatas]